MSTILFAAAISFLILIHELGHLWAAKRLGIPVARFSIGLGPRLFGCRRGGTDYAVALVPIGGYVLPDLPDERAYERIPIRDRMLFALAGPIANLLLAVVVFAALQLATRGLSPVAVLIEPWRQTADGLGAVVNGYAQLFTRPQELSGVIGIVAHGGRLAGLDPVAAVGFLGMLSINLAVLNLLPLPPLDGGKILMGLLEAVHKPLARLHIPVALVGWVLLLALMAYATVQDVGRFFGSSPTV